MSTSSVAASVLLLGLATSALAATGEYENMDAVALAQGKTVKTDCSISSQLDGKTYCFGSQQAMNQFMQNPKHNLSKAHATYMSKR